MDSSMEESGAAESPVSSNASQHELALPDKADGVVMKPTFKSTLQAKKRLQAFFVHKPGSLPTSPLAKKPKLSGVDDMGTPTKKTSRKGINPNDKAKAVIEEIEEIKRFEEGLRKHEQEAFHQEAEKRKSRSRSHDRERERERFKKIEKKSRNYRRRSTSLERRKSPAKKPKRIPKNWAEFVEFDLSFNTAQNPDASFSVATKTNHDMTRHLLFDSPSLPINIFKMKTVNREEKMVPFQYIRYTRSKPVVAFSVNFTTNKEASLNRKQIFNLLPTNKILLLEKLYSHSFRSRTAPPSKSKSRCWYSKKWKDLSDTECQLLENSVGLSFLQSYTGEEEEEVVEPEIAEEKVEDKAKRSKHSEEIPKKHHHKNDVLKKEEKKEDKKEEKKEDKKEEILKSNISKSKEADKQGEKPSSDMKKSGKSKKHKEKSDGASKKKKKKKKKRAVKENEESDVEEEKPKRRKRKKDKAKKEKHVSENPKKPKEKKKKEKLVEVEENEVDKNDENAKYKKRKRESSSEVKKSTHEPSVHPKPKKDYKKKSRSEDSEVVKDITLQLDEKKYEHIRSKTNKHDSSDKKTSRHKDTSKIATTKKSSPITDYDDSFNELKHDSKEDSFIDVRLSNNFSENDALEESIKKEGGTPDTDEYHSHWESDDDLPSSIPKSNKGIKASRSWESDEELFDRTYSKKYNDAHDYEKLEIPLNLNIKTLSSRRDVEIMWEESSPTPTFIEDELKLLEAERRSITEERKKLEIEKEKVRILQEKSNLDFQLLEQKASKERNKEEAKPKIVLDLEPLKFSSSDFDLNRVKVEKVDDFNIESLNSSILNNGSSLESSHSFPIAALEDEYEEFIKAVSTNDSEPNKDYDSDKSDEWSITSGSSSDDRYHKRKRRHSKKKKRKSKIRNNIFNEFDIPIPSDLPEALPMVPTPVPVPSPTRTVLPSIPSIANSLVFNSLLAAGPPPPPPLPPPDEIEEKKDELDLSKPFVFSSIVLPSKKSLLDNSNLKLDDDSDSADFTDKFVVKKPDFIEEELKVQEVSELKVVEEDVGEKVSKITEHVEVKAQEVTFSENVVELKEPEVEITKQNKLVSPKKIEEIKEKPESAIIPEKLGKVVLEKTPVLTPVSEKRPREVRTISPAERRLSDRPRERRRSRSRERDLKKRSPVRFRGGSPSRKRNSSPRRRSPSPRRSSGSKRRPPSPRRRSPSPRQRSSTPRRRSPSPRHRSLSPRRRLSSPSRYRRFKSPRRSPSPGPRCSLSPRGRMRRRSPSPRSRRGTSSPLNSPLDGFKRSVADSTISDDMLPQPTLDDYVESSPSYGSSRYYDKRLTISSRISSLSPTNSPKRISLDDRINQVLGLEKLEAKPPPVLTPSQTAGETYNPYSYPPPQYDPQHQYTQFGPYSQPYGQQKNEYPYQSNYTMHPPPPIPIPVPVAKPQSSKVVQIGNILQVVPNEEIPQRVMEPKPPETGQKIVQVGNMLQIVPAVMPMAPHQPHVESPVVQVAEVKPTAEAVINQKNAERKAEREKRRLDREKRRKEKDKKRKEREKRRQMKLKLKTENMIKKALQLETQSLALETEEVENTEVPIQWPPVPIVVSGGSLDSPSKGILIVGGVGKTEKKSVQFADGVRPGEGTSPSGGEELSSPPPMRTKLPKEKRYKKLKVAKKSKKKKIKVKVIKKVPQIEDEEEEEEEDDDNMPPPSPPPGSPPPHVFPSRVKTHTINNVHQFMVPSAGAFVEAFRPPPPMAPLVLNRPPPTHVPPPYVAPSGYHTGM